jgi:hypothetical protein
MKELKMSKWFNLPVDCDLVCGETESGESNESISINGYTVLTGHHVEKVEIAINSFDKHAEQIKQLREALDFIVKVANFPPVDKLILKTATKALEETC